MDQKELQQASIPLQEKTVDVQKAEKGFWKYFSAAMGFTVAINILLLISPIYMLQIYDRVLTSGSQDTLIVITFIAVFMLIMYIAAEGGRKRLLSNAGDYFGQILSKVTLRSGFNEARVPPAAIVQNVTNLSKTQTLLVNATIAPLLDAPFAVFFIGILYLVNPALFVLGFVGAIVLLALALINYRTSNEAIDNASKKESEAQIFLTHTVRQRAAIVSMGLSEKMIDKWYAKRQDAIDKNLAAVNKSNFISSTSRSIRQILQVLMLGAAAGLALQQEITPGAIIAASILMGRGLAPIDQTVGILRHLIKARHSWTQLKKYLAVTQNAADNHPTAEYTKMPRPEPVLKLEEFTVAAPGAKKPLLPQLSFELETGCVVAIIGASGSGKTSLLQTIAGAWMPAHGLCRLGNRDIHTWHPDDRGRFVGYLPQDVELLTGSVFENIARFTEAEPELVYAAARQAGCHDLILSLPEGYDTMIGEQGAHLSAGQRQAIGMARALFGNPAMMLLDEPTAHLDSNMVGTFLHRLNEYSKQPTQERQSLYLIATHDPRIINCADRVMIIQNGKVGLMTRDEYLRKISDLNQKRVANTPPRSPNQE